MTDGLLPCPACQERSTREPVALLGAHDIGCHLDRIGALQLTSDVVDAG